MTAPTHIDEYDDDLQPRPAAAPPRPPLAPVPWWRAAIIAAALFGLAAMIDAMLLRGSVLAVAVAGASSTILGGLAILFAITAADLARQRYRHRRGSR